MFNSIPELFFTRVEEHSGETIIMIKKEEKWHEISWDQARKDIITLASALLKLGIKEEDKFAILSDNSYQWSLFDYAILSLKASDVPIYSTNTPQQVEYILRDSNSVGIYASTQELLDKVLKVRENLPDLKIIISLEGTGPDVMSFDEVMKIGAENYSEEEILSRMKSITREDLATIIYTSGTTGEPKGVMLTHGNLLSDVEGTYEVTKKVLSYEVSLSFLPWTHSFGRTVDLYAGLYHGRGVAAIAESIQKVPENILEIRPTMFASVPRVFEKVYSKIISEVEKSPPLKRKIFYWAVDVGKKAGAYKLEGKNPPFFLSIKNAIANALVFKKIKAALGGRLKFAGSGGAPLAKELAELYYAMGIKIIEGYGLTETSPVVTINDPLKPKFGSVGKPIKGAVLKIAEDGEILIKGPMVMKGYYNKPEATKEAIDEEGWFHTGDIGRVDEEGFYYITDRKKDLIVTAGGKNIAPQPIENALKMNRFIEQAVMIGDKRPYCVALLQPDFEELEAYAKEKGIEYSDMKDLLSKEEIGKIFEEAVQEVNSTLPRYSTIKKFELIPFPLTPESGELTPTLKVKRRVIDEKYKDLIDKMYS